MADEVHALSNAVHALSLAQEENHKQQSPPPRPTLPLPRELRDKIYSYLLSHQHVHGEPYKCQAEEVTSVWPSKKNYRNVSTAHTFKFHTNVLATNHQTFKEAMEVLTSNNFVVVSYRWPCLDDGKHQLGLPVVSEKQSQVAKFKLHVLRVHVQHANPDHNCSYQQAHDIEHAPLRSFLMVADELDNFCITMQNYFYATPAASRHVVLFQDPSTGFTDARQLAPMCCAKEFVRTRIQFQSSNLAADKHNIMLRLLAPFRGMILGGQRATISNYDESLTTEVGQLTKFVGPTTVWMNALVWNMIETAQKIIEDANTLVTEGDFWHAHLRYDIAHKMCGPGYPFQVPDQAFHSDIGAPMALLKDILMDAAVMDAMLCIKEGQYWSLRSIDESLGLLIKMISRLPDKAQEGLYTKEVPPQATWRAVLMHVMLKLFVHGGPIDVAQERERVQQFEGCKKYLKDCPHFEHDLRLLETLVDDPLLLESYTKDGKFDKKVFTETSAYQLPVRIYSTPLPAGCKRLQGHEGFVDTAGLERLRASDPELAAKLV